MRESELHGTTVLGSGWMCLSHGTAKRPWDPLWRCPPCHGDHGAGTATSQNNLPGGKPSLAWDGGTPNKMLGGEKKKEEVTGIPHKSHL